MFIKNYGLFWKRDAVWWGQQGNKINPGNLLGVLGRGQARINFREQIGFYALYDIADNRNICDPRDFFNNPPAYPNRNTHYGHRDKLIYCGYSGSGEIQRLLKRLSQQRKIQDDKIRAEGIEGVDSWNQFSWFGIRNVNPNGKLKKIKKLEGGKTSFLHQIEAVMIAASRPVRNEKAGNFGDRTQYFQFRDPILDVNR